MAESAEELVAAFRAALDLLASEQHGLLFQPLERVDSHVFDSAVADLDAKKRIAFPHLSKEEFSTSCMIQLLHGILKLRVYSSLNEVQAALSASCEKLSHQSEVLSVLFDCHQLHGRPIRLQSTRDVLSLPMQLYERRPRQSAGQRKRRRIFVGYPSIDDTAIAWKIYIVLIIADMLCKQYDTFDESRHAILQLGQSLEPHASSLGSLLSVYWIDTFLGKGESPTWLDWKLVIAAIQHYDFE
jgi:hypothetical protein